MKEEIYVTIAILNIILGGQCFRSDMMYQKCGSIIEGRSGEVIFDASKLPTTVWTCIITVRSNPKNVSATNRLLLYFTDISLQDDCNKNVLKVSGISNTSLPSEKGKAVVMCGDSLSSARKGTILITSGSKINVSFTRHVQAFGQLSAHFTLKYLSFHRGVCDVNNDVECSQKGVGNICVPKDIVCARKVEVCNSFNISTCSQNPEDKKSLEYLKYILCALLGIFMLFGIKFFYRQYRKGRSNENCISKLKQRFVRDDQDNSNELTVFSAMDNYSALRESVPNIFYNSGRENNIVDTPVCTDNNATTQNIFSPYPSAPTLEEMGYESPASLEREVFASLEHESPASLERELPASPPPTYDESVVPSYTEVMTHKDKYIVH